MTKRALAILIIMSFFTAFLTTKTYAAGWQDSGIPVEVMPVNGVYEIYTAEQLAWIAYKVNHPTQSSTFVNCTVKLMNDIDLSAREWTPIGGWNGTSHSTAKAFAGKFDGNNKRISGMYIGKSGNYDKKYYYTGLLGYVSGSIENVHLVDAAIYSNRLLAIIGLIVGSGGNLSNCSAQGYIESGDPTSDIGGLVGHSSSNTKIEKSYSKVRIEGGYSVGGLVGDNKSKIYDCYSMNDLTAKSTVPANVGGLVGSNYALITSSYAYSSKLVGGTSLSVGGIAGRNNDYYVLSGNYWNIDAVHIIDGMEIASMDKKGVGSGNDTTNGLATDVMKNKAAYLNWDFQTIWNISADVNDGLPYIDVRNGGEPVPPPLPYRINRIIITNQAGIALQGIPDSGAFVVDVEVTKNIARTNKDYLVIALYDSNGKLLSHTYMRGNINAGQTISFGGSVSHPQGQTVSIIKAFVWNSFSSMQALSNVVEY